MGDGCASCLTRNIVWWMNLVFLFAGLGIIGVAIYVNFADEHLATLAGKELGYATIGLGAFICILATCALCGARKTVRKCWMWIYAFFLTLLVLGQIAIVVILFTQEARAKEFLEERWLDLSDAQREEIMEEFKCGSSAPGADLLGGLSQLVCGLTEDKCFDSCYAVIKDDFTTIGSVFTIVSICVVAVELVLLLSSCCLLCEDEESEFYQTSGDYNV